MPSFYKGDNLTLIRSLESESVDFIYVDPPFFSGANHGDYDDRWNNLDEYLVFLRLRIEAMRPLLKSSGLIAVHLD